jgi:hypothetical protein
MKHAIDMGSGATIYIPSFIKISLGIQQFIGGIHRHTRQHGDLISLPVTISSPSYVQTLVSSTNSHLKF